MSKSRIGVVFAVLVIGVAMGLSAQTTASLTLQGTVAASTAITVTPAAAASSLTLNSPASDLTVATIAYYSNDPDGFNITVDSANDFALRNTAATVNNLVSYSMRLSGGTAFSEATPVVASSVPEPTEVSGPLLISYTGSGVLSAGTFADTLTFTIATN